MTRFTVLSWNIACGGYVLPRPFGRITRALERIEADILCLQECPFAAERLSRWPRSRAFTAVIPARNTPRRAANGCVILSRLPVLDEGFIDFRDLLPSRCVHQRVTFATIRAGGGEMRVYSCHLEVDHVGPSHRLAMLERILLHAGDRPAIVCGDMNTVVPRTGFARRVVGAVHRVPPVSITSDAGEGEAFAALAESHGFRDVLDPVAATWVLPGTVWRVFDLKLDWFFVRGIEAVVKEVGPFVTDHRSFVVECHLS